MVIDMQILKEDIRNKILQAALEEFYLKGYEKASLQEIAKRCAISKSNVYNYFPSKKSIYDALTMPALNEIAKITKEKKVLFFTDAVQAIGHEKINLHELGADMLSCSGHKINAPKGTGFLYIRKGVGIRNLIEGGGQEKGKRSGTENVAYAVALAKALELACEQMPDLERVAAMRDRLIHEILAKIPDTRLNGHPTQRLPGNVNLSFDFIEGESMILLLDSCGICASTGSACSNNSLEPSHVLLAIGLPHEKAHGSLRLSLSHETTDEDVDYILEKLPPIIQRLRDMSPLYNA